jgi:cytochrome P450
VVGINTWVAHRNEEVFGEEVESFRPERWIENPERICKMNDYYIPVSTQGPFICFEITKSCATQFGHGSRTCIGKNISLMEMSKLIPELVRMFDFTMAYPKRNITTTNVWFVKQMDLEITIRLRDSPGTQ